MKKTIIILAIIFLILICAVSARNVLARFVLIKGVKAAVGLDVNINKIDVGVLKTYISIDGLRVSGPAGFNEKTMADIPRIYVEYEPGAFLKGEAHLKKLVVELKEFVVERNSRGDLNVNSIKGLKNKRPGDRQEPSSQVKPKSNFKIRIDSLELKVGNVIYKDYMQAPAAVSTYQIGIDEKYENITDVSVLVKLIVTRALMNTAISRFSGLDLGNINKDLSGIFKNMGNTGFDTVDSVTKQLENILK